MFKRILVVMAAIGLLNTASASYALESDVDLLLDLLVKKGVVTKDEATDFRAVIAMKKQEVPAKEKPSAVPEWVQNIKWGGDVRFRTQGDWGKATGADYIQSQRWRERVRGRFYLEAKVNDFTAAGTRIVGGNTNPRSGDDTLDGYWSKDPVMFDQYYIRFDAPKEMVVRYGRYFSDMKLWLGRFANPFETSEMVWDPDITPGGWAFQYTSPEISNNYTPSFNFYSNIAMLWVDESGSYNTDPLMWGFQMGVKTATFGAFDSKLNVATGFYDFANLQHKTPANSALTNSRVWRGDLGPAVKTSANSPLFGTYAYEYNVFDLLVTIDNNKILDYQFPHGFYSDFIYNASCHKDNTNKGVVAGAYIGKNKVKDPKDWKVKTEWRYLERDSVPDFLPDSNFWGFGTYTGINNPPGTNGIASAGGTNARGVKTALEYMLFKNTAVNLSYYWMEPIKSYDKRNPWSEALVDVIVKF